MLEGIQILAKMLREPFLCFLNGGPIFSIVIVTMYPLVIEHGYRKSPFFRGKPSIYKWVIFREWKVQDPINGGTLVPYVWPYFVRILPEIKASHIFRRSYFGMLHRNSGLRLENLMGSTRFMFEHLEYGLPPVR